MPSDFNGNGKVVDGPRVFKRLSSGKRIPKVDSLTGSAITTPTADSPHKVSRRSYESAASATPEFRSPLAKRKAAPTSGTGSPCSSPAASRPVGALPTHSPSADFHRGGRRSVSPTMRSDSPNNFGKRIVTPERHRSASTERRGLLTSGGVPSGNGRAVCNDNVNRRMSKEIIATTGNRSGGENTANARPPTPVGRRVNTDKNAPSDWGQSTAHRGKNCQFERGASLTGVLRPQVRAPSPVYRVVAPFATN